MSLAARRFEKQYHEQSKKTDADRRLSFFVVRPFTYADVLTYILLGVKM